MAKRPKLNHPLTIWSQETETLVPLYDDGHGVHGNVGRSSATSWILLPQLVDHYGSIGGKPLTQPLIYEGLHHYYMCDVNV